MDFTGQYNFANPQPYHQFMPIPPLTPSHSHSAGSDDFNASPPVSKCSSPRSPPTLPVQPCLSVFLPEHYSINLGLQISKVFGFFAIFASAQENYDALPTSQNDQFQSFDYTPAQGFNTNPHQPTSGFPGPPTPPGQNVFASQVQVHQQQGGSMRNGSPDEQSIARGGSEEDENLTPAQSRRKAQNRAAQRAFRERKERHVKDLEAKLAGLEAAQQQSSIENERLKRDLQKMSTENEILRATSHVGHGSISPEPATGPLRFKPTDFYSNVLQNHTNKSPSHRIVTSDDGERLLAAGATWDFIISHELFKKGLVDIADVSERLKNCARCDGQGPVFSERSITNAIEQSVASGTDDLL
ncbi:bzip transcription factor (fcr3) [Fusarium flagelliforme]|uniref:Bzip transcription factor (Fcr3) n=1 Tax=Fusarium flagelliforme TaxID=2675880 RepID=A0A395MX38_9HYPO|nr:bzip transcription factor (fcr3) [Fusarium flagelliforme]